MSAQTPTLQSFVREYILKMMPGALLDGPGDAFSGKFEKGCDRNPRPAEGGRHWEHPFLFKAGSGFTRAEQGFIFEIIEKCRERAAFGDDLYGRHVILGIIEDAISRFVAGKRRRTLLSIIALYGAWSSQTYEGNRISHTIGILNTTGKKGTHIRSVKDQSFLKIVGSGHDTILILDGDGHLVRTDALAPVKEDETEDSWSPVSMAHVARWAENGKIAVSLTRDGEILIFRDKSLIFVRRRGAWRYLPHRFLTEKMRASTAGDDPFKLKRAIYHTAMDVAFSQGGACIGLVPAPFKPDSYPCIPDECLLGSPSPIAAALRDLVGRKPFYKIPRSVRAELCSIDGATIVDTAGKIHTVGAILITDGNADGGGGRTAAAKTLAKYGLGVKVSNDGYVQVFSCAPEEPGKITSWCFA